MSVWNVGAIIGSLSKDSINRRLFHALNTIASDADLVLHEISIADLTVYNRDFDADYPPAGRAFKTAVEASDALMIVTPEYNRSIPGVLKNALDWGSRPWGTNSFAGKPSAVIGTSTGPLGTAIAQQHLRSVLSFLGAPELGQPEAYIRTTPGLFTDDGQITDDSTAEFLLTWLKAFHTHISRNLSDVS